MVKVYNYKVVYGDSTTTSNSYIAWGRINPYYSNGGNRPILKESPRLAEEPKEDEIAPEWDELL